MIKIILLIGFISFGLWLFAVPLTKEEKEINIKAEYEGDE
jgi:hypothetical protein